MKIKYFMSPTCWPCRSFWKVIEELSDKYDIKKIDISTEDGIEIAKDEEIKSTPSVLIKWKVDREILVGAQDKETIINEIERQLKDE